MNNVNSVDQSRVVVSEQRKLDADVALQSGNIPPSGGDKAPQKPEANVPSKTGSAPSNVAVNEAVEQLNDYVQSLQRDLRFTVDEASGRTVVRVLESSSDQVVRQIPTETALRLAQNLKDRLSSEVASVAPDQSGTDSTLGIINTTI